MPSSFFFFFSQWAIFCFRVRCQDSPVGKSDCFVLLNLDADFLFRRVHASVYCGRFVCLSAYIDSGDENKDCDADAGGTDDDGKATTTADAARYISGACSCLLRGRPVLWHRVDIATCYA